MWSVASTCASSSTELAPHDGPFGRAPRDFLEAGGAERRCESGPGKRRNHAIRPRIVRIDFVQARTVRPCMTRRGLEHLRRKTLPSMVGAQVQTAHGPYGSIVHGTQDA